MTPDAPWYVALLVSLAVGGGLLGAGIALGWWLRGEAERDEVEREIATWAPSTEVDLTSGRIRHVRVLPGGREA